MILLISFIFVLCFLSFFRFVMDTFFVFIYLGFLSGFCLPVLLCGHFVLSLLRWVRRYKVLPYASLVTFELFSSVLYVEEFTVNSLCLGSLCVYYFTLAIFCGLPGASTSCLTWHDLACLFYFKVSISSKCQLVFVSCLFP